MKTSIVCAAALSAAFARGEFVLDRSVMDEAYLKVWNEEERSRSDADIERLRKADAAFAVSAPDGTDVKVEQLTHAFFFGAHIFNFNQLGKKEWNDRYKNLFGTLFNSATVAFYWRTLEPYPHAVRFEERYEDTEGFWNACPQPKEQPHWRRPATDPVVSFLRLRGCRIHGHALVWDEPTWSLPSWLWDDFCPEAEKRALEEACGFAMPRPDPSAPGGAPDREFSSAWKKAWAKAYAKLSADGIAALVPTYIKAVETMTERRIREIAARYGSRVDSWDVVNESARYLDRLGLKSASGRLCDVTPRGGPMPGDYVLKSYLCAMKYLPQSAWLNINEAVHKNYHLQVLDLVENGARIDVVGSQMHLMNPAESVNISRGVFRDSVYGKVHPKGIEERFATLSSAGRPVHLSEITITAPDNSSRGQMIQAVITDDLYRKWFSTGCINGITWWNVVDDCGAPGEPCISGLFTRDMRPKAAYFALDDLINRRWKTRTSVKVADGKVSFRGFKGRYRLTWKDASGQSRTTFKEVK